MFGFIYLPSMHLGQNSIRFTAHLTICKVESFIQSESYIATDLLKYLPGLLVLIWFVIHLFERVFILP